jgi:hypothetical protein
MPAFITLQPPLKANYALNQTPDRPDMMDKQRDTFPLLSMSPKKPGGRSGCGVDRMQTNYEAL